MNTLPAQQWAKETLAALGIKTQGAMEEVRFTPWSQVSRFPTLIGAVYLKHMSPQFAAEPLVLASLAKFSTSVPEVIAHNASDRCFLMKDAGMRLRERLKKTYDIEFVAGILKNYAQLQIQTINKVDEFLSFGIKDWRLSQMPNLYQALGEQTEFLQKDGLTQVELKNFTQLLPKFTEARDHLATFQIPETLEHGDFQDNNVLIMPDGKCVFNDWGDANITHPFFSLGSWLDSASRHHAMNETDPRRSTLINAYLEPWQQFAPRDELRAAFEVSERLRPVLFAINFSRVASCPGMENLGEFKGYIANALREWLQAAS